jgi:probable HAF family extracellular repeat protein
MRRGTWAITLLWPIVCAQLADASITYTVTDLGPVYATGLNNSGQVVGRYVPAGGLEHGFLWSNGHLTDLGVFGTGANLSSVASAINNYGQVVGTASSTDYADRAIMWNNGQMINIGTLGSDQAHAAAINNSGQIAGSSSLPFESPGMYGPGHAYLYSNGQMNDLGTLGGRNSGATAINNFGQVAGVSETAFNSHAFLYTNGIMIDIGTLSTSKFASSNANAINDAGQVIGDSTTDNGQPHGFIYTDGHMLDLGGLSVRGSSARGVNNSGQVVGSSGYVGGQSSTAFIWQSGVMTDLNSLIDPNLGIYLGAANAINDNGQVLATGGADSYLLTPSAFAAPEPAGALYSLIGLSVLLLQRRPVRHLLRRQKTI